jgi:hypothetical protein
MERGRKRVNTEGGKEDNGGMAKGKAENSRRNKI